MGRVSVGEEGPFRWDRGKEGMPFTSLSGVGVLFRTVRVEGLSLKGQAFWGEQGKVLVWEGLVTSG